jgi:hypothetical protein
MRDAAGEYESEGAELGRLHLAAQSGMALPEGFNTTLKVEIPVMETTSSMDEIQSSVLETAISYTDAGNEKAAREYLSMMDSSSLARMYAVMMKLSGTAMTELLKRSYEKNKKE